MLKQLGIAFLAVLGVKEMLCGLVWFARDR